MPPEAVSAPVQTAQAVTSPPKTEASRQAVEEAVKSVNDFLKPINDSIRFSVDEDTGISVIKVIDLATKDVIRQFPSEEMLTIAKAIDQMKGLLVQQKV
jgi:flagellar protein FlaG